MPLYSDVVMEHFRNPRNVGVIGDADGIGEVGNPVCGDMMTFYIKVADGRIDHVKFQTFGCGAAIAVSSMVSELAKGKTVEEAKRITNAQVAKELMGLPPNKMHCSNLGADALHKAIEDYESRRGAEPAAAGGPKKEAEVETGCSCPYCEGATEMALPICRTCGKEIGRCPSCEKPVKMGATHCPSCGAEIAAPGGSSSGEQPAGE